MTKKIASFKDFEVEGIYKVKEIQENLGISEHLATLICLKVRAKYKKIYNSGLYGKKKVLGAHVAEIMTGSKQLLF